MAFLTSDETPVLFPDGPKEPAPGARLKPGWTARNVLAADEAQGINNALVDMHSEIRDGTAPVLASGSTTRRTLGERFGEVKNVKDFGAVGDGVTDDTQAFVDANAARQSSGADMHLPEGTYSLTSEPPMGYGAFTASAGAYLKDVNTGEKFRPIFTRRRPHLRQAWQDRDERTIRTLAPTIVCYGDSNTRYYQGDTSTSGPFARSYPAQLDVLCGKHPALWQASVINRGFPGENAQYGIDNWTLNVAGYSPEVVVYGFGTNDIKLAIADLESYVSRMNMLIIRALDAGIVPIVLGIPWFYDGYGADGVLSQQRLPVWNNRLAALCAEYRIPFIDTYSPFKDVPSAWFNEAVAMRHYNARATRVIAHLILRALLDCLATQGTAAERHAVFREQFTGSLMPEVKEGEARAVYTQTAGDCRFQTLKVSNGASLKLAGAGRWLVGFYPVAAATGTIVVGASTTNVTITPSSDAGEFYPVQRHSSSLTLMGTSYDLVITATSGDLYIRYYAFEEAPAPVVAGSESLRPSLAASALPATPVNGRDYYLTDLMKPVTYFSGGWLDFSGYRCVGTTAQRTTVGSNVPKGFTFYDTDTATKYRSDGAGSWTAY